MKIHARLLSIIINIAIVAGCVSVESTRAQLSSGNPQLIQEAHENIFNKVVHGGREISDQERIRYVQLAKDFDLLCRLFKSVYDEPDIAGAVARQMDFSEKNNLVQFIKDKDISNCLDSYSLSHAVTEAMAEKIVSTAKTESLEAILPDLEENYKLSALKRPIGIKLARTSTSQDILVRLVKSNSFLDRNEKHLAYGRITDQKALMDLFCENESHSVLKYLTEDTICAFIQNDKRAAEIYHPANLLKRITDEKKFVSALTARTIDGDMRKYVKAIKSQKYLACLVAAARNQKTRSEAVELLKDQKVIAELLSLNKINDESHNLELIQKLKNGDATEEMYNSAKSENVRFAILGKLTPVLRAKVRKADSPKCETMIAAARSKGKETFELGGFYLGMPFEEVDRLVGYYCPGYGNGKDEDDSGNKRLWIPNQEAPFCIANDSGSVYEFNFGKTMLENWYKYDVQDSEEWVKAYSRETQTSFKEKTVYQVKNITEKSPSLVSFRITKFRTGETVYDSSEDNEIPDCHVILTQTAYIHNFRARHYKVTYFGERTLQLHSGEPVEDTEEDPDRRSRAEEAFMDISAEEGTLRVRAE